MKWKDQAYGTDDDSPVIGWGDPEEWRECPFGRYGLWQVWQGEVSEDSTDVAEADEDGGGRDEKFFQRGNR